VYPRSTSGCHSPNDDDDDDHDSVLVSPLSLLPVPHRMPSTRTRTRSMRRIIQHECTIWTAVEKRRALRDRIAPIGEAPRRLHMIMITITTYNILVVRAPSAHNDNLSPVPENVLMSFFRVLETVRWGLCTAGVSMCYRHCAIRDLARKIRRHLVRAKTLDGLIPVAMHTCARAQKRERGRKEVSGANHD